tara:strand:+ start:161 stop:310 length:150 start_codon:yes stop_codon:yes gene_type:complete
MPVQVPAKIAAMIEKSFSVIVGDASTVIAVAALPALRIVAVTAFVSNAP